MANPPTGDTGWRRVMSREDRVKVCQHIMAKLATYYHMVPEQALREKTSAFESQAYTNAESRTDYLKRIAGGLSNVERQVQQATSTNANLPSANGAATTSSNPVAQVPGAVPRPALTPQQAAQQMHLHQQQQLLQAHGQMPPNQFGSQVRQHLLLQQQAKHKQQMAAKAAASGRAGSAADVKKAPTGRTRSSSSSAAGGSTGGRSKSAQAQAMAKNAGQQVSQGRPASFNGAQANAAGAALTPEFLLALQNQRPQAQFTQQAIQQAAQLARQQNSQNLGGNVPGVMSGMGLNSSTGSKQSSRNPAVGNPAAAGFLQTDFPSELTRKFSQEQLNQMAHPQSSLGLATGVSSSLSVGNAGAMSQGQSSRAMSAQMLQHSRLQQGMGMQSGNPNSFARAAIAGTGLSVSQMNAMMAQTSQNNNADNIRATHQGAYANFQEGVRPRMNQGQAAGQRLPNAAPNASEADEQFWAKLESMKQKYKAALHRITPFTHILADGQPPLKQEQFRKHLKDCFHILQLERGPTVPPRLTTGLLEKAERFINSVITVYQTFTNAKGKHGLRNPTNALTGSAQDAALRAQQYARIQMQRQAAKEQQPHTSPQNQQQVQFMNQLQQQQLSQQPSSSALSATTKGSKAVSGRVPNRAQHIRVPRQQVPPQANALQAAQLGMSVKPEQLSAYGIATGAPTPEQELKALQQRQQLLQAQQAQQQHLSQSFQHPSLHGVGGAKVQAQLAAHGSQALSAGGARMMDSLQMQRLQAAYQRSKIGQMQSGNGAPGVATPPSGTKPGPMALKQEGVGAVGLQASGRSGVIPTTAPGARRHPGVTLEQKMQHMQSSVKVALERAERFEQFVEKDLIRGKAERIQNTLAALRNSSNSGAALTRNKRGLHEKEIIKAKTVFESSSDQGLRLAKRPKNEAADLKSLKEAVEADCRSAQERNPLLSIEISEEFGQPVVTCQLLIEDIKLPKLFLRVQRGYPRKGGATFGFERPPLGWVGVLDEIRTRFKRSLANAPATSVGVAAFLDAWVREAEDVIENNLRGHLKNKNVPATQQNLLKSSTEPIEAN